ncbi:MAG: hypothetical protein C4524_14285 [Candidatus Zixiibacteriota bacterium]|nr:MAG: hypothetical protein C4524_14285 [candidate division Zixibacteria bacterium]
MKEEKVCNLCHRKLPASEFYTQKTGAGTTVLRSRCKECYRAVTRDYYQLNREELLQRQRQQYKKRRSYLLNYYRTHREERLKYQREWYRRRKAAQNAAQAGEDSVEAKGLGMSAPEPRRMRKSS